MNIIKKWILFVKRKKQNQLQKPAEVTIANVKSVLESYKSEIKEQYGFLPIWEQEQIQYRINESKGLCLSLGHCYKCGCDIPALQRAKKSCDGNCYPEMMGEKEWNEYKLQNNIKEQSIC